MKKKVTCAAAMLWALGMAGGSEAAGNSSLAPFTALPHQTVIRRKMPFWCAYPWARSPIGISPYLGHRPFGILTAAAAMATVCGDHSLGGQHEEEDRMCGRNVVRAGDGECSGGKFEPGPFNQAEI